MRRVCYWYDTFERSMNWNFRWWKDHWWKESGERWCNYSLEINSFLFHFFDIIDTKAIFCRKCICIFWKIGNIHLARNVFLEILENSKKLCLLSGNKFIYSKLFIKIIPLHVEDDIKSLHISSSRIFFKEKEI